MGVQETEQVPLSSSLQRILMVVAWRLPQPTNRAYMTRATNPTAKSLRLKTTTMSSKLAPTMKSNTNANAKRNSAPLRMPTKLDPEAIQIAQLYAPRLLHQRRVESRVLSALHRAVLLVSTFVSSVYSSPVSVGRFILLPCYVRSTLI
ncbi:hypothetical protein OF83DRAFT_897627 [Amylostereum chailletii]|nr:hypothetical protein OF83DRAFT_897627 [Amylostereum chailletii]